MNIATVLAIVGVAVTVFFGIVVMVYSARYPGRFTFINESCVGLFDSVVRGLPDLSISFRGQEVFENLVMLKGVLINTGSKDISPLMIERPLSVLLPEDYVWLGSRVVSTSPDVGATTAVTEDGRRMRFEMGLLRKGEYIRFEAIARVPSNEEEETQPADDRLKKAITFDHRIEGTRRVDEKELPSDRRRRWLKKMTIFTTSYALVFGGLLTHDYTSGSYGTDLRFLLQDENVTEVVKVTPLMSGNIRIKGQIMEEEVSPGRFVEMLAGPPEVVRSTWRHFATIVLMAVIMAMMLYFVVRLYQEVKISNRIEEIVNKGKKGTSI